MEKVWIFGDSYAQRNPIITESTKHLVDLEFKTWPLMMEDRFNVENFAKGGTGPSWSINQLLNKISSIDDLQQLKQVNVIFFISAIWRLDLSFYTQPSDQHLTAQIPAPNVDMINRGWNIFNLNYESSRRVKPYSSHKRFVSDLWKYYLLNDTFQQTEIIKSIGAIKLLSTFFKKVLVWPVFHKPVLDIDYSNDNFYYIKDILFGIEQDPFEFGKDPRQNHLTNENHLIMFEELKNWVVDSKTVNIDRFIRL